MKILFIHASAGAGHFKAAEALYNKVKDAPEHDAHLVDALDYTSPFFKTIYRETYASLITYIPSVWGVVFRILDIDALQPLIRAFRRIHNAIFTRKLAQFIIREKFDYIFSTHFMPNEVVCALKRKGLVNAKFITCITDYDVHKIWVAKGIDHFCVATVWTKERLLSFGIDNDRISITGIPTDERFADHPDIGALKKKVGIEENQFTVLVATGSFGIGPIEEIISVLNDFQVIVVCGHNKGLYARLSQNPRPLLKVLPLVNNMFELMAVSDVMVSKPGGLSISEALVKQLPLVFFNAIPGQESNNIKVLKHYGIGISGKSIPEIGEELRQLRSSRDKFLTIVKRCAALAKPSAVKDILQLIGKV